MAKRRLAITALLFCLCLFMIPCEAYAISTSDAKEPISTDELCGLNLSYTCNGAVVSNVPVKLFRVADISASAQYSLTTSFAASGLKLNGIRSSNEWDVIRSTLESYILANNIAVDFSSSTDQNGRAQFESLKPGLYLLSAVHVVQNGWSYSFDSALISLPGLSEDGLWQYRITVAPKSAAAPPSKPDDPDAPDEEIQYKILKLWKDENGQAERPKSIDVEIFRNGESYEIVSLSEAAHWSYTWTAKDDGADWMVVERNIPSGYSVTVEERTTTFILTNTLIPDAPPPDNPPPDNPPPDTPPDSPETGDSPHLLLYTVLMYVSGGALVLLGITGKKKRV